MDTWAPVVRYANEGTGYWTNDTGTLNASNNAGGPGATQTTLRANANATDTAGHDVQGNQWTDAYGEVVFFPNNFSGNTGRRIGVWLRVASSTNCYTVQADGGTGGNGNMTIAKIVSGSTTSLGTTTFPLGDVTSYVTMRAEIQGDQIRAFWRGQRVLTVSGDTAFQGPGFVSVYLRTSTAVGDVQVVRWEAGPLRPNDVSAYTSLAGPRGYPTRLR